MKTLLNRYSTRLDLHQSPMHKVAMAGIGWETWGKPGEQIFLRRFGPINSAKMQRPKKFNLDEINDFRKSFRTTGFYLEPGLNCKISGKSKWLGFHIEPFAHSVSSLVDLAPGKDEILKFFSQKTRYNINYALKKEVVVIKSFPLSKLTAKARNDFFDLRASWSKRKNVVGYDEKFLTSIINGYRDHGWIHLAYIGSVPEATLLVLENDHVATYYSAFSSIEGYKHFAPTLLTWVSMLKAKRAGCDIYDFGGIYDHRYPKMYKKWIGFTKFKEGFHPTVVTYPTSHLKLFW